MPTDDFVIVCDGPLTAQLDQVLEEMMTRYPGAIHPVRLEKNMGIGYAAQVGLEACRHELVAKMDADDIAVPNRFEMQLKEFASDEALAVCGGYIEEFSQEPDEPFARREVPLSAEEIRKFGRRRMPFNNVTVMYRRSRVIEVGGYAPLRRNEDYDLFSRLLVSGAKTKNIPQVLVKVRVDAAAYRRRGSWGTIAGCFRSRWRSYQNGYSSLWDVLYCVMGQLFVAICPAGLQNKIYMRYFRRK